MAEVVFRLAVRAFLANAAAELGLLACSLSCGTSGMPFLTNWDPCNTLFLSDFLTAFSLSSSSTIFVSLSWISISNCLIEFSHIEEIFCCFSRRLINSLYLWLTHCPSWLINIFKVFKIETDISTKSSLPIPGSVRAALRKSLKVFSCIVIWFLTTFRSALCSSFAIDSDSSSSLLELLSANCPVSSISGVETIDDLSEIKEETESTASRFLCWYLCVSGGKNDCLVFLPI